MDQLHKELLSEIVNDWGVEQLEVYIGELRKRAVELEKWITHVKLLQRKKVRKPVHETGARDGR